MDYMSGFAHAIILLFVEGGLLVGILALFDYSKPLPSNELPLTYARKFLSLYSKSNNLATIVCRLGRLFVATIKM